MTPFNFYLLGCILTLPIIGTVIKRAQDKTPLPLHPVALGLTIIIIAALSWVLIVPFAVKSIYYFILDFLHWIKLNFIEWAIRMEINRLKIDPLKNMSLKEAQFVDKLRDFMIDMLVNKTDAFDNTVTREAIVNFIEKCLLIKFTTPEETLKKMDEQQFVLFSKFLEILARQHSLKAKNG